MPPADVKPKESLWRWLGSFSQIVTFLSVYASGLLGIVVVQVVGPYLAMGAQMYTGNTEPQHPHLAWPFWMTVLLGLLPMPALALRRWSYAMVLAVPLALLPWWQLYQLYLRAATVE